MKSGVGSSRGSGTGTIKFIGTYIVLMGIALVIIGYEPIKEVIDINGAYSALIARITAFFIKMAGLKATASGPLLHTPDTTLEIRFGCNGLEAVLIYTVAILSFPASWRIKLAGIVAGFLSLQLFNVIRISALAFIHHYLPDFFDIFHLYIAQGMMIAIALALFMGWMSYADKR